MPTLQFKKWWWHVLISLSILPNPHTHVGLTSYLSLFSHLGSISFRQRYHFLSYSVIFPLIPLPHSSHPSSISHSILHTDSLGYVSYLLVVCAVPAIGPARSEGTLLPAWWRRPGPAERKTGRQTDRQGERERNCPAGQGHSTSRQLQCLPTP